MSIHPTDYVMHTVDHAYVLCFKRIVPCTFWSESTGCNDSADTYNSQHSPQAATTARTHPITNLHKLQRQRVILIPTVPDRRQLYRVGTRTDTPCAGNGFTSTGPYVLYRTAQCQLVCFSYYYWNKYKTTKLLYYHGDMLVDSRFTPPTCWTDQLVIDQNSFLTLPTNSTI